MEMSWMEWVVSAFSELAGLNDKLLQRLWKERKLQFNGQAQTLDLVDKCNNQLICEALYKRESIFIALPDTRIYRSAFLFASAIIQSWLDSRQNYVSNRTVLYFGATIGIREHLRNTAISGIKLVDVFKQQDLGKRDMKVLPPSSKSGSYIPQIITIYSPADPAKVLQKYKPVWIGIDCGDAAQVKWLEPLLKIASERKIPVIGWGQNPLSESLLQFAKYGHVFRWPIQIFGNMPLSLQDKNHLASVLQPEPPISFQPFLVQDAEVLPLENSFQRARQALARGSPWRTNPLARDALQIHWQYLRSLATLSVPFDLYEAESSKHWGIQSLLRLQEACQAFREACRRDYSELTHCLEEANGWLDRILNTFQKIESPLWRALSHICIEESPTGTTRLITFTSRARKHLFLFALLAQYNITEEDLETIGIRIITIDDLQKANKTLPILQVGGDSHVLTPYENIRQSPLLVGLPSSVLASKLLPLFFYSHVDVLIYSFQMPAFLHQTAEWIKIFEPDILQMINVLSHFSGMNKPDLLPHSGSKPNIDHPIWLEVKSGRRVPHPQGKLLWQAPDLLQEITYVLEQEGALPDDYSEQDNYLLNTEEVNITGGIWHSAGVEVELEGGWHALFAPDEMINVIIYGASGARLDLRYIQSLRPGDRIVAIPGQRRQNLYSLLLSRIHKHPSIEIHLALIRRWQEDFVMAYQRWRQNSQRNVGILLKQMQDLGSRITTSATLRQWLWGQTLCPDDVEDLHRLAETLEMDFVAKHYKQIHNAANRLRSLHRTLSKRLNNWLDQETENLTISKYTSNDIIDVELGITFDDFRNSLLMLSVLSVRNVPGPFLRSSLGRLERR